jgi:hypothetical protein
LLRWEDMAPTATRIACFWATLSLGSLPASVGWAASGTPVALSPHRLTVMGEWAVGGTDISPDGHYGSAGNYYGGMASYLYQGLPWLEWGGKASYGHTDYSVTDQLLLAGQVRATLVPALEGRAEIGLSLSTGLLTLVVPGVSDDGGRGSRTHWFLAWVGAVGPDLRFWVSAAWALTLAGNVQYGTARDVVDTPGYYLESEAGTAQFGGLLGAVILL